MDSGANCTLASDSTLSPAITCTDDGTYKVTLTVNDGMNPAVTSHATVTVANVKPTVTSLVTSAGISLDRVLVGYPVTFHASASDTGANDTINSWAWKVTGSPVSGSASSQTYTFPACGTYTVSAVATDDDGDASDAFTLGGLTVYDLQFQQPLDEGKINRVNGGKVLQVKIEVADCNGTSLTGLSPQIQLFSGDVTPSTELMAVEVETYSNSARDSGTTMRAINNGYSYHLGVPTTPGSYTVRVRPFGDAGTNPPAGFVLLEVRVR